MRAPSSNPGEVEQFHRHVKVILNDRSKCLFLDGECIIGKAALSPGGAQWLGGLAQPLGAQTLGAQRSPPGARTPQRASFTRRELRWMARMRPASVRFHPTRSSTRSTI
jgi:hypothetical protein